MKAASSNINNDIASPRPASLEADSARILEPFENICDVSLSTFLPGFNQFGIS